MLYWQRRAWYVPILAIVCEFWLAAGFLPLFDKQFVDPKFDVQVVAVARFVSNSHSGASHYNYYL